MADETPNENSRIETKSEAETKNCTKNRNIIIVLIMVLLIVFILAVTLSPKTTDHKNFTSDDNITITNITNNITNINTTNINTTNATSANTPPEPVIDTKDLPAAEKIISLEAIYDKLIVLQSVGTAYFTTSELKVMDGQLERNCNWTNDLIKPRKVFGCMMDSKCQSGKIEVQGPGNNVSMNCP